MHWDATITAGNALEALTMVFAVIAAYVRLRERLISLEARLEPLWEEFTQRRIIAPRPENRP